jgi:hypothetical protein
MQVALRHWQIRLLVINGWLKRTGYIYYKNKSGTFFDLPDSLAISI